MKVALNEDASVVGEIMNRLEENRKKYGKRYCPCKLGRNDDTVCMCRQFVESEELGECHCGLYVKLEV